MTPRVQVGTQQFGTQVFGVNDRVLVMAKDARTARESLPGWGMTRDGMEIWKDAPALDPEQKAALAGHAVRVALHLREPDRGLHGHVPEGRHRGRREQGGRRRRHGRGRPGRRAEPGSDRLAAGRG
ncbi:hypothetical protein [Nonomuraea sp. NPDC049480]|uniref:hypothetical protein n=1 Tax=Nonomuraea sp. NPDC049480 TaxID=3364353 RepID=UPI00378BA3F0